MAGRPRQHAEGTAAATPLPQPRPAFSAPRSGCCCGAAPRRAAPHQCWNRPAGGRALLPVPGLPGGRTCSHQAARAPPKQEKQIPGAAAAPRRAPALVVADHACRDREQRQAALRELCEDGVGGAGAEADYQRPAGRVVEREGRGAARGGAGGGEAAGGASVTACGRHGGMGVMASQNCLPSLCGECNTVARLCTSAFIHLAAHAVIPPLGPSDACCWLTVRLWTK